MKKVIILSLALVVPVGLVFFLRNFGKNQFDLPVLYESVAGWPGDCPVPDKFPFLVSDSIMRTDGTRPTLVLFGEIPAESGMRLPVEIDTAMVRITVTGNIDGAFTCRFGAPPRSGAVLVDPARQVRGVFDRLDRDEMDRLIMEIKILQNDY